LDPRGRKWWEAGELQNEEPHSLHALSNIRVMKFRRMRWVGHVAHMEKVTNAYNILVGKHEEMRPLKKPRHKW
jgi:hypothetical protein